MLLLISNDIISSPVVLIDIQAEQGTMSMIYNARWEMLSSGSVNHQLRRLVFTVFNTST